jgi:hypothetical protein
MVDCAHGNNEFKGWKLSERLAIYGDMVGLLCETNLIAIGSGIVMDAYESLSAEHKELLARGGFFEPLDLVFQCDLQFAIDATVQYGKTHTPPVLDDLGLIFDESPADVALVTTEFTHTSPRSTVPGKFSAASDSGKAKSSYRCRRQIYSPTLLASGCRKSIFIRRVITIFRSSRPSCG